MQSSVASQLKPVWRSHFNERKSRHWFATNRLASEPVQLKVSGDVRCRIAAVVEDPAAARAEDSRGDLAHGLRAVHPPRLVLRLQPQSNLLPFFPPPKPGALRICNRIVTQHSLKMCPICFIFKTKSVT